MGLFGSRAEPRERRARSQLAAERANRVGTPELTDWAEGSVGQVAQLLASYRNYHDKNALPEAIMVCESLIGILEALQARQLTSTP